MRQVISVKLKLLHTPAQKSALDAVSLAFRDGLNLTSTLAFEHGKTSSPKTLQSLAYRRLRNEHHLPSQLASSCQKQVAATYQGLWTKVKKNALAVKLGHTTRRYNGLDAPPKYVSRTLEYQINRDYSWKKNQVVSVLSLEGRLLIPYQGYSKHLELINIGMHTGAAKLYYQKSKKQYYLLVSLTLDLPDPVPTDHPNIVGVDVGQRYLYVATDRKDQTLFASGPQVRQKKDQFSRRIKTLRRKGTRSATRRRIALSGRERRFTADHNHVISKALITRFPHALIGMEDLNDIRERTEGRSRPKADKEAAQQGGLPFRKAVRRRKNTRRRSQWSFAELQGMIAYKATLSGSLAVKVHANFTSQCCPACGHCSKGNRPGNGLSFVCEVCGKKGHADLMAGRNIALRTLLVRQDWMSTGVLSIRPDVSYSETKAAHPQKYAELRWSTDTSL